MKYVLLPIIFTTQTHATTVICGNENEIVNIDEDAQEVILNEKELECLTSQSLDESTINCNLKVHSKRINTNCYLLMF